ncbi:AMP-binding protein [Flavobacterium sp.]|uniref:AMP-binding protein n=1 Tax=Flavobacterium sp. TaxID=239 RepID=UPI00262A2F70|nr:AMP-binding protein [Flavobacterium sp.]MDD2986912.1 AMP-binding protein [Flavobacterium sp.]
MTDTITYQNVHNKFKLNGFHLNREDLCTFAYSFIKEGEDFEKPVGDFLLDWFDDKSYLEINTSGSTGIPKLIRVDKQAMVNSALATGNFFDLQPGDKVLHCLPAKYVAGKMMFIRGFILGLEIDFVAPSSHPLDRLDYDYDFAALVPMQAQYSLDKLKHIKKIIIGGAKITKPLEDKLLKVKSEIYETYGMTETITHIAAKRIGEEAFTVFPNVMLSLDDNNCLLIKAPSISNELIETNDIVEMVSENEFIWLGRYDNVVNSGGIKLIPEQIEEKLATRIPRRYFVIGQADPVLGEKLVLIVEGEPIPIEKEVFDVLDKYEKPKEIHFVKHFEETPTGKIIRKETLSKFMY